jgi:threonine synthase
VSEQSSTANAGENNEQGKEETKSFEAITSQEEFDKAIQARIARERAKIPADYEDLKAKATEFEKWQESQKTEAQRQADRLAEIERENAELKAGKTRAEVAEAKGVPAKLLSGSTRDELEAAADALIAFKGQQPTGSFVPAEGKTPSGAGAGDPAQTFAGIIRQATGR